MAAYPVSSGFGVTTDVGRDVRLPALGLGTAPLGWLFDDVSAADAVATVRRAIDVGIGYVDTAPSYGLGRAEDRVGEAIRSMGLPPVLSTKTGHVLRPRAGGDPDPFPGAPGVTAIEDWSRDGIREAFASSLERLGTDSVDILLIHDPDDAEPEVYAHAWPAVQELRDAGLVRAIGFGMNSVAVPTRFVENLDVDVVLSAGRYNLLDRRALPLLDACARRGTAVVCGGVLGTGILASGDPAAPFAYGRADDVIVGAVGRIRALCSDHGVSIAAAALHFPLCHPAVASVVVGMRSPEEVDANCSAFTTEIPEAFWADLDELGLEGMGSGSVG